MLLALRHAQRLFGRRIADHLRRFGHPVQEILAHGAVAQNQVLVTSSNTSSSSEIQWVDGMITLITPPYNWLATITCESSLLVNQL